LILSATYTRNYPNDGEFRLSDAFGLLNRVLHEKLTKIRSEFSASADYSRGGKCKKAGSLMTLPFIMIFNSPPACGGGGIPN
jgi:hypothetical protein